MVQMFEIPDPDLYIHLQGAIYYED